MKVRIGSLSLGVRELGVLALFAAVMFSLTLGSDFRKPFVSAEVRFVETSPHGANIIPASCPSDPLVGGCGSVQCHIGWTAAPGGECVFTGCPVGYTENASQGCVFTGCPAGYTFNQTTGLCEQQQAQCTPQNVCGTGAQANMVVNSCTNAVVDNCNTHGPDWYCSGGQCVFLPQGGSGSGWIQVTPALVRTGEKTLVTWSTTNLTACRVTENNPNFNDQWNTPSGSQTSSIITQRTTYTLTCDGAVIDTATVNIIPVFIET